MTLTEFLLARVADDAAAAQDALDYEDRHVRDRYGNGQVDEERIAMHRRVLAECEAKRRLVDLHTYKKSDGVPIPFGPDHEHALGILAAIYADHPDYDAAWSEVE